MPTNELRIKVNTKDIEKKFFNYIEDIMNTARLELLLNLKKQNYLK